MAARNGQVWPQRQNLDQRCWIQTPRQPRPLLGWMPLTRRMAGNAYDLGQEGIDPVLRGPFRRVFGASVEEPAGPPPHGPDHDPGAAFVGCNPAPWVGSTRSEGLGWLGWLTPRAGGPSRCVVGIARVPGRAFLRTRTRTESGDVPSAVGTVWALLDPGPLDPHSPGIHQDTPTRVGVGKGYPYASNEAYVEARRCSLSWQDLLRGGGGGGGSIAVRGG